MSYNSLTLIYWLFFFSFLFYTNQNENRKKWIKHKTTDQMCTFASVNPFALGACYYCWGCCCCRCCCCYSCWWLDTHCALSHILTNVVSSALFACVTTEMSVWVRCKLHWPRPSPVCSHSVHCTWITRTPSDEVTVKETSLMTDIVCLCVCTSWNKEQNISNR